jgi:HEPN domain-containing protein
MKETADLVRGWLRKADGDRLAMDASIEAGVFDAACFHAQQTAEKCLKAFLIHKGVTFPYSHNLAKLVELCAETDPSFRALDPKAPGLTPYAMELRYDNSFWPSREIAEEARATALAVRDFVLLRLPKELSESPS